MSTYHDPARLLRYYDGSEWTKVAPRQHGSRKARLLASTVLSSWP